jgi:hypothetical protein
VEIDHDGWRIVGDPPVKFTRSKGMSPLPVPVEGGDGDVLWRLLNLKKDHEEDEQARRLILAWLVQALRACGPYPVLMLLGGQGTAKSTAARIVRSLVDPSSVPLRTPPKNEHDLAIDGASAWVIAFDNISELPGWLSDAVCRLATGGGFSTRTLFTDRDQELFEAQRPVILNGITDVATRPDLLDRAVIVNLQPIEKATRRSERAIFKELEEARPALLGFLCSAISEGLREFPDVKLENLPRMADFARWAVATEKALGGDEGLFMSAYDVSQKEAVGQALEASPIVVPLWKLASAHKGSENAWVGTATDLLKELADRVDDEAKRVKGWPQAANTLSRELKRLAPPLRDSGIITEQLPRDDVAGTKRWSVHLAPTDDTTDDTSDDTVRGTVREEKPIKTGNPSSSDETDGSDDVYAEQSDKENCIHEYPGGIGCYICDPDHPSRRV